MDIPGAMGDDMQGGAVDDGRSALPSPAPEVPINEAPSADTVEEYSGGSRDDQQLDLSAELELRILNQIDRDWEDADAARTKWLTDKREGLNLYWGIIAGKDFPFKNCANLHVPLIRTIADTLHSNLIGSIDFDKPASVYPVGAEDVPKARKVEKLLNWQFTTQVDYFKIVDQAVTATLLFGHAPIKVWYTIERENGRKVFDGIRLDVLPPERFLMPPDARDSDVQKMDYVIQEIPMSRSDIKKRMVSGRFRGMDDHDLDALGFNENMVHSSPDRFLENVRERYSGIDSETQNENAKKNAILLEWHASFDIDDDGIDESITVTCSRDARKILRVVRANGKRPFVVIRHSPIADKPVGESVADQLRHINQELNTLHNQRVDSVTISNIPFFFYDPLAGFDPSKVTLAPGTGIPVSGSPSQAVYFPTMNGTRPEMYREEDQLFQYAERMMGAGTNTQGILQSKRVTATEVAATDRRAGIRFLTLFNRIKRGFRDILNIAVELDREFMPEEVKIRVVGVDGGHGFDTITKDDLNAQLDVVVNGNSIIDDQAEKQEMMQAYQLGMTNPIIMRDENAIYEMTRDLYLKLGVKRVDSYLRKPLDTIPKNPEEEHNLFLQEEEVKPNIGENIEDHLNKHSDLINSPKFDLFSPKGKALLLKHYSDTLRMDKIIQQMKIIAQIQAVNAQSQAVSMAMAGGGTNGQAPGVPAGQPGTKAPGPQPRPAPGQP